MESIGFEAVLVVFLILLNGFFAGAEIAVLSARRSRIDRWIQEGKRGAKTVAGWLKEPEAFLATVQIGVTLVGVLASAVGGAAAVEYLKPKLLNVAPLARWAEPLSIAIVVVGITYLSLVLGELVPKSLALIYRERMACLVALPIRALAKTATPLVLLLTSSTRLILRLLGRKEIPKEMFISEEEIRFLIKEGGDQGVFDQTEQQFIPKVFDFSELQVKDLMLPREKIVALEAATPREHLLRKVSEEGYTRLPIYKETLNNVVGILHMKDLIHALNLGRLIVLEDMLRPAVFVRDVTPAKELLRLFQRRHLHMAIVQDVAGRTVGLATLEDLVERIVGDIQDEHDVV
jgi:putative hemolysin